MEDSSKRKREHEPPVSAAPTNSPTPKMQKVQQTRADQPVQTAPSKERGKGATALAPPVLVCLRSPIIVSDRIYR